MPAREEAAERGLLGGLYLAAQSCKRRAPQPTQHLRVTPLALGSARPKLAADELVPPLELAQGRLDVAPKAFAGLRRRERPARAGEAAHQGFQRRVVGLEEDLRKTS